MSNSSRASKFNNFFYLRCSASAFLCSLPGGAVTLGRKPESFETVKAAAIPSIQTIEDPSSIFSNAKGHGKNIPQYSLPLKGPLLQVQGKRSASVGVPGTFCKGLTLSRIQFPTPLKTT